jgi:PAS domain S-box-containing protein
MSDPERTRRRLQAQTGAARVLLSSDSELEGVRALLRVVCESHGWALGEYWAPSAEGPVLHLATRWADPRAGLDTFVEATASVTVDTGSGLAGRVLDRDEPVRIERVTEDPEFIRAEAAGRAGIEGAYAVPVPLTGTNAILLFLDTEPADDDPELLDSLAALGAQLGQFIDRRRAEEGLRESEDRFRTFARTVPDPAFLLDHAGHILYANRAVTGTFGYEPRELYGEPFAMLLPERHRARHEEGLRHREAAESNGVSWATFEVEAIKKDGSELPVEITYGTFEKDGERFFTAVARDVTDRLLSEDRLRFQARLLDAVGEAVIATQLDGTVLYWNEAAERLYGWSAGEVMGRTVDEITPADVSRSQAEEIMHRLREGESWSGEFLVRDKAGREFPVRVTDSPFLDDDGEVVGMIGTSSDITERKRTEAAQRFLSEAGRVLAASLDYQTTVRTVARLAVPILADFCLVQVVGDAGEPETVAAVSEGQDALLRSLEEWADGPGRAAVADALRRCEAMAAPASDGPELIEDDTLRELGFDGVLCVPLRARGNALGVMTLAAHEAHDKADWRLAAELGRRAALAMDNARLYRDAQEANRAKADFLAVVSHELRTPLNAIGGYADLLESEVMGELSEGQARYVERIKLGAGHLAQLIDEILTFARVEARREQLLFRSTDLGRVAAEAVATVEPQAREKGLDLVVERPDAGPELITDGDKVRQVLVNLLSNAVKYTDEGTVTLSLESTDDGGAVMAVTDTGVGIEAENLDRVFEPFWQAEKPNTRRAGGTGLGLSVNQRLVTLLGGTLEVESEPGVGSTFTARLPASPPKERPDVEQLTGRNL